MLSSPNMPASLSASSRLVVVFGGSGFLGSQVVRALAARGYRVRAAVRRPEMAHHLQPLGNVGQIQAVQANLRYRSSVERALEGAWAAVNLVGILAPTGRQSFEAVQALGAESVAQAAAGAGVERFVHVSAIGADAASPSVYGQTKARGEQAVFQAVPRAIVLRPSVVFGADDTFFNRFATLARFLPVLPLPGAHTRFQPVFVGDVAETVARSVDGSVEGGHIYELGGPDIEPLETIIRYILTVIGLRRLVLPLTSPFDRIQAGALEIAKTLSLGLLPDALRLTRDQVALLGSDNVVSAQAIQEERTLQGVGIVPTSYEAVVPGYLWRFRKAGQFETSKPVV